MQLRIAQRVVVLAVLSVVAAFTTRLWVHESCSELLWPWSIKIAYTFGTSIVIFVPAIGVCIWIKDAAALGVAATIVVGLVGAAIVEGTPATPPMSCGLSQAEKQKEVTAFTEGCLKRAASVPPMSQWPQAYRIEACSCTAVKYVDLITVEDLNRINSRGYLDAEETQRLLIIPTTECFSVMINKYPNIPRE
jgi:hypothetical protein